VECGVYIEPVFVFSVAALRCGQTGKKYKSPRLTSTTALVVKSARLFSMIFCLLVDVSCLMYLYIYIYISYLSKYVIMVWFSGGGGARPIRCLRDRRWLCGWEGGGDRYVRFEIFYDFYDVIAQRCAE